MFERNILTFRFHSRDVLQPISDISLPYSLVPLLVASADHSVLLHFLPIRFFRFQLQKTCCLTKHSTSLVLTPSGTSNATHLFPALSSFWDRPACFLSSRHGKNSPENKWEKDLFTAAWRALPLLAGGCWFCPQTPAWRAGCPAVPTDGLSPPAAIWIWATWTCDKKQKPWWGGRPTLTNK